MLAGAGGKLPDVAEVGNFVQYVLIVAVQQIDRFWGETSVRNWLFSISLKLAPAWKRRRRIQNFFRRLRAEHAAPIKSFTTDETTKDALKTAVEQLPAEQSLTLALRYGLGLRLSDLADVLKVTQESAHERLVVSRRNLGEASGIEYPETHAGQAQFMRLIQRQHDGLLDRGGTGLDELEKHLAECSTCRAVDSSLHELERSLVLLYQESWILANIDLENQRG